MKKSEGREGKRKEQEGWGMREDEKEQGKEEEEEEGRVGIREEGGKEGRMRRRIGEMVGRLGKEPFELF